MRELATIRKIDDIRPIVGADMIEAAILGGWSVVVKKGDFSVGDLVIYLEIDSWVPHDLAPFLSKGQPPREYNGIVGERLRTVRLRGQLSQGLILPLSAANLESCSVGDDVTTLLNITKYEPPIPASLSGDIFGVLPSFIPRTNQERIQNLTDRISTWNANKLRFEVTEKLDGTSCTVYRYAPPNTPTQFHYGVCGHNFELKYTENNTYWAVANKLGLESILTEDGRNLAIQGEIIGNGIQKNYYGVNGHALYVFDIFDINAQTYLTPQERVAFCALHGLPHVPVIESDYTITEATCESLLNMADGQSALCGKAREGLVFKCITDARNSFKAINNKWLLKNQD